jgi:hypothetical protein
MNLRCFRNIFSYRRYLLYAGHWTTAKNQLVFCKPSKKTIPTEYAPRRHCKQSMVLGMLGVTRDQGAWIVCPPEDSK